MFDFRKSKNYTRIVEKEELVSTVPLIRNSQILSRVFETGNGMIISLVGPANTGKHSLLASVLGREKNKNKIVNMVFSKELFKSEEMCNKIFTKMIRSTITVKIKEQQKIIEGEVTALSTDKIQLKTMDMESVFEVGVRMGKELERERVCIGDIVKIYKESCFVTRTGRASSHSASFRSDLLPIISIPEGECIKIENTESALTLDELDIINSNENGEEYLFTNQIANEYIQSEVDKKIYKWIKEKKATLDRGVLIIDNCELLTPENLLSLEVISNQLFTPFIVLIFNQNESSRNNGILLKFQQYTESDIAEIIRKKTGLIDENSLDYLLELATRKGIEYTIKIIDIIQKPLVINSIKRVVNLFTF